MKRLHALLFACALAIGGALVTSAQTGASITYTETTTAPGATIQTPTGATAAPATTTIAQKTITFDGPNAAAFSALCQASTAPAHLTGAQLAVQYTPAELAAALAAALPTTK